MLSLFKSSSKKKEEEEEEEEEESPHSSTSKSINNNSNTPNNNKLKTQKSGSGQLQAHRSSNIRPPLRQNKSSSASVRNGIYRSHKDNSLLSMTSPSSSSNPRYSSVSSTNISTIRSLPQSSTLNNNSSSNSGNHSGSQMYTPLSRYQEPNFLIPFDEDIISDVGGLNINKSKHYGNSASRGENIGGDGGGGKSHFPQTKNTQGEYGQGLDHQEEDGEENDEEDGEDVDVVVDILPSFQLYESLHRHIPTGNLNPDSFSFPPNYSELSTYRTTYQNLDSININTDTSSSQGSQRSQRNQRQEEVGRVDGVVVEGEEVLDDINQEQNDNIYIDKIYSLPNRNMSSVAVAINLIKSSVRPNKEVEKESMLKEYTSGDIINGYVTICNQTTKPIKFEMFYVSLEGYATCYDSKLKRKTTKRFLRSVDLSASWSYSNIEISSGVLYEAGAQDETDGTVLGLTNDRILLPKVVYKKYFMFKLPTQLLDTSCRHENLNHCQLPPSFGIDRSYNDGLYSSIDVNPILCYGHNGAKGSPILTTDLCPEQHSINYSIEAKIVALDKNINNSQGEKQKLYLMKDQRYNIRFIPFSLPLLEYKPIKETFKSPDIQINKLEKLFLERLKLLINFMNKVEKKNVSNSKDLKKSKEKNEVKFTLKDLYGEDYYDINDNTENNETSHLQRKMRQLYDSNRTKYIKDGEEITNRDKHMSYYSEFSKMKHTNSGFVNSNSTLNETDEDTDFEYARSEMSFSVKEKYKSIFSHSTSHSSSHSHSHSHSYSKQHAFSSSSSKDQGPQSGIVSLKCKIPKDKYLPYIKPSLLKKSNTFEIKNKHDQQNWTSLISRLGDDPVLHGLELDLTCVQANNVGENICPPDIQLITSELIVITSKSLAPIPINLTTEFLHDKSHMNLIVEKFNKYRLQIEELQNKFSANEKLIKEICVSDLKMRDSIDFENFISKDLLTDVLSLSTINVNETVIKQVFFKQTASYPQKVAFQRKNSSAASEISGAILSSFKGKAAESAILQNNRPYDPQDYRHQCLHEWEKIDSHTYTRKLNVFFKINKEISQTLVPSFESCLSSRKYMIRLNVKFEHSAGIAKIDIPVTLKICE